MTQYKILFVCIHNSARSQMAEAFLNHYSDGSLVAESAGIEAGTLNPNVVTVMKEAGIDISGKTTQSAFELVKEGRNFDAVITVCDAANAERCPVFPGRVKRVSWSFPDPSSFQGTPEQKLNFTREVRDAVERAIKGFIIEASDYKYWATI